MHVVGPVVRTVASKQDGPGFKYGCCGSEHDLIRHKIFDSLVLLELSKNHQMAMVQPKYITQTIQAVQPISA